MYNERITITPSSVAMAMACPASAIGMHAGGTYAGSSQTLLTVDPTDPTAAGTLTHRIAAEIIQGRHTAGSVDKAAKCYLERYPDTPRACLDTATAYARMVVDTLTENARRAGSGAILGGIETPVNTPFVQVSRGTVDAWTYDARHRILTVIELKTGPQDASGFGLIQCRVYALSLAGSLPVVPSEVSLHVWQNGKETSSHVSWSELQAWRIQVLIPALGNAGSAEYHPADHVCRYCPHHDYCTAAILHAYRAAAEIIGKYADLREVPADQMKNLLQARQMTQAANNLIKNETDRRWADGEIMDGITAAPGRRTIKESDEEEVLKILSDHLHMDSNEIRRQVSKKSCLTVSAIDRLTGSRAATERILGDLITVASSGKYNVSE